MKRIGLLLLAAAGWACSDPNGSGPRLIEANQIVTVDLVPRQIVRLYFLAPEAGEVVFLFQTLMGSATIKVTGAGGAELLRRTDPTASSDPLDRHAVGAVTVSAPAQLDIDLTGSGQARIEILLPRE
jgi:hypothetical protein